MRLQEYLCEFTKTDRENIQGVIASKTPGKTKVSNTPIEVKKVPEGVLLSYDSGKTEVTLNLVDICDKLGKSFQNTASNDKTYFLIKV